MYMSALLSPQSITSELIQCVQCVLVLNEAKMFESSANKPQISVIDHKQQRTQNTSLWNSSCCSLTR